MATPTTAGGPEPEDSSSSRLEIDREAKSGDSGPKSSEYVPHRREQKRGAFEEPGAASAEDLHCPRCRRAPGSLSSLSASGERTLIPGMVDEITIQHILTRVRWKTLWTLSTLNRMWRRLIAGRRAYEARVQNNCAETLIVIAHSARCPITGILNVILCLFDPVDNVCHSLPPLPNFGTPVRYECAFLELNGKLYLLGGQKFNAIDETDRAVQEVHILDLGACQLAWKRCADMETASGIVDNSNNARVLFVANEGKIYALNRWKLGLGGVFYPTENRWIPIPNIPRRTRVGVNEKVLVSLGGEVYAYSEDAYQVYNPGSRQWRQVLNTSPRRRRGFGFSQRTVWVIFRGKLFSLYPSVVESYDAVYNSWTEVQTVSWAKIQRPEDAYHPEIMEAVVVDDEVVAQVRIAARPRQDWDDRCLYRLCISTGFGQPDVELVWDWFPFHKNIGDIRQYNCLCSIQL